MTPDTPEAPSSTESSESFGQLLSDFERGQRPKSNDGPRQIEATVIAVNAESVFLDIGMKIEGVLPLSDFVNARSEPKPGDRILVSIKGRNEDGYYSLSRQRVAIPTDWSALERAFNNKETVSGRVTGVVKGGLSVDVGVRAFMPASRSGARDASEMEKLVDQEIRCRIIKLDSAEEDVVVDRRAVAEEEAKSARATRYSELREGDIVRGEVRSIADYGAFIDLGGVDGLLHVGEISWSRIGKPGDVLSMGQQVEAKVIRIEPGRQRISLSMKQLQTHPWEQLADRFKPGDRVRGAVTRVMEFGAFVELEPGIEGLIHVSEMSWAKKVRIASDIVKPGDSVDVVVLGVNPAERRIALGLKQALGDPWAEAAKRFAAGTVVQGTVTSFKPFGAFVQLAEGVEGLIHVSEIAADRRLNHPQDALRVGQSVQAVVLQLDSEKRQLRLSMKQLVPTSLDEYLAERKPGDTVTGRIVEIAGTHASVELGQGILATAKVPKDLAADSAPPESSPQQSGQPDLSALTSMLNAKWKGKSQSESQKREPLRPGQIRSFRISKLDPAAKTIELDLA
jgi:small subunit ribosomal protein S1